MFNHSHSRHVDRVPAKTSHASFGKVLPRYISGRVQVGIQLVPTAAAAENRLCGSVPLVDVTAFGAPL
jgi:hypothetical protein